MEIKIPTPLNGTVIKSYFVKVAKKVGKTLFPINLQRNNNRI